MSDPTEWAIDTVTCVSCPACAFTFDAVHSDADGGYSCPACAEVRLKAELDRLRVEVQTVRGEAYARVGELAAQRAAVLALHHADHRGISCDYCGENHPCATRRALGAEHATGVQR